MTAAEFYAQVLGPAAAMDPIKALRSEASDVTLMAFAGHESNWTLFRQIPLGPGRGPWMLGLVTTMDVLLNDATKTMAAAVCSVFQVDPGSAYSQFTTNLPLAYAFARLLLWADPNPLPIVGNSDECWTCYTRVWRPGIPHQDTWASFYAESLAVVTEAYGAAPTV